MIVHTEPKKYNRRYSQAHTQIKMAWKRNSILQSDSSKNWDYSIIRWLQINKFLVCFARNPTVNKKIWNWYNRCYMIWWMILYYFVLALNRTVCGAHARVWVSVWVSKNIGTLWSILFSVLCFRGFLFNSFGKVYFLTDKIVFWHTLTMHYTFLNIKV